jgi:hypothetical protein
LAVPVTVAGFVDVFAQADAAFFEVFLVMVALREIAVIAITRLKGICFLWVASWVGSGTGRAGV